MYLVEIYGRVRRVVLVEGRSQRSIALEFGLARVTVRKMLGYSIPPGYRREEPAKRPKLGLWVGMIDAILEEDKSKPAKQRHTAKRIFDRLRAEHAFPGGYTIVKDYVRAATLRRRKMFVPLRHAPGMAQADFGEALAIVGGEEQKAHYFAIDLPHSDDCFVRAFPAETTEAFLEGHVQAFCASSESAPTPLSMPPSISPETVPMPMAWCARSGCHTRCRRGLPDSCSKPPPRARSATERCASDWR
jgi:transposase